MKEKECFPQKKDGTIDMCEVMKENAEFSNSVLELSNSVLELTNSKTELESKVIELEKRNCDKWEVGK